MHKESSTDCATNIPRGPNQVFLCTITRETESDELLLPPPPPHLSLSLYSPLLSTLPSSLLGGQATSASEAAVSDTAKPSVKLAHHRLHLKTVMATPAIHWAQNFLIEQGEG
jgi:hypothetical protein